MSLGAFSVSLAVKDIAISKAFYEQLGFNVMAGDQAQGWLIMADGATKIGLFQGMIAANTLTFNPGWTQECEALPAFEDVRAIQSRLQAAGVVMSVASDVSSTGPAHCVFSDPDGNVIMFDQHVPKPD